MGLAHLYKKPGHLIRRAQQIAVAIFMDECAAHDLTPVQYAALIAIKDYPGIDATRLAGQIAFDRPTVGGVLERLEAKGLVARRPAEADRRVKLLRLTDAGAKLLERAEGAVDKAQARILAPLLARERAQLMALLTKLVDLANGESRAPRKAALPKRARRQS